MQAGTLRSRVVIERQATEQDEIGQPVTTWTTLAAVWANILHKSGAESIRGDRDTSVVEASIRIRRRPDIDPSMRIAFGTRLYGIKAVLQDDERLDHLDLVCERVD